MTRRAPRDESTSGPAAERRSGRHPEAQKVVVRFTEAALTDLQNIARKGDPQVVRWVLEKCLLLERNPEAGEELRGALIGYRKLVVGNRDWRVIWRVTHDTSGRVVVDVAEVWAVGPRSDSLVYEEVTQRVTALRGQPHTVPLADALETLGRLARGLRANPAPVIDGDAEPDLPVWLVQVLTQVAGMPAGEVAKLSEKQAQAAWEAYTTTAR